MNPAFHYDLFGVRSSFDETAQNFDLAIEIHMPGPEAFRSLYQNVFTEMSGNGRTTFHESLRVSMEGYIAKNSLHSYENKGIGLPINRGSSFRIFPANFVGIAFSGFQAVIEFFEIPPDLLHFFSLGREMRPRAGVKPVVSVVVDTLLLWGLLEKCKTVFEENKYERS